MEESLATHEAVLSPNPSAGQAAAIRPPSIPAVVFAVVAVLVPIALQKPLLNSDGDLARHLRHGSYMLEHRDLIRHDPFSFTRPGAPFVGFEYGSQLTFAVAERIGGLPAVAILAGLLIALTYALLTAFLLRRGVDPLLACLIIALAVMFGIGHWSARPHLYSFLATVLLMSMLEGRTRRAPLATAMLFVIWANLHGGFVYGWILIGVYLLGSGLEFLWGSDRAFWRERFRYYLLLLAIAISVTILNPHWLELHGHLIDFFGTPYLRDSTAEFVSPNFHETGAKAFLCVLLVVFGLLSLQRKRPTLPRLLLLSTSTAFALLAVRNVPLFGLTALPVFALHMNSHWQQLPDARGVRARFEMTASRTSTWLWVLPLTLLLVGLALSHGRVGSAQLIRDEFDATVFPVAAVSKARSVNLQGRLFTDLAWGGYVLYGWPEQKVFIDGGSDFYGEEIFREYVDLKTLNPGWRDLLSKRDISLLLLDRQTPLSHELARDGRWGLWYCDSLAVMFRRVSALSAATPEEADSSEHALNACGEPSS